MQAIIKKRPSRNINVQNFWLYIFGMLFNLVAICVQDFDAVINKSVLMISSFRAIISVTVHDIELLTIHFK
jgi:UDP-sugar transporter A1/2/3